MRKRYERNVNSPFKISEAVYFPFIVNKIYIITLAFIRALHRQCCHRQLMMQNGVYLCFLYPINQITKQLMLVQFVDFVLTFQQSSSPVFIFAFYCVYISSIVSHPCMSVSFVHVSVSFLQNDALKTRINILFQPGYPCPTM